MILNEEQQKAADTVYGPTVVLAGPGSGKTAVITRRTIKLIRENKIPAGNILVVTFTKAAAEEMKRRLFKAAEGDGEKQVTFGTFHSLFFKILRFAYGLDGASVVRDEDALRVIAGGAHDAGLENGEGEMISEIRGEIGKVKGSGGLKKGYIPTSCPAESFEKIYAGYEDYLKRSRLLDFEDMMLMTESLFLRRPEVLDIWREKFKFIMIDEFQDINPLQYKLIRQLAEPENNLFIVGDDDQAIYGFRGADPGIMLNFEKDYPGAKKIILKKNYRSCGKIVDAANKLISRNHDRFKKEPEAVREEGEAPDIRCFENRKEENQALTSAVRRYKDQGFTWGQMAVIYRTNRLAGQTASAFGAANIPFSFKGSFQSIYSHFAVRDVLSYIMLARGDRKRETALNIINRPRRYFPRDLFVREDFSFEELKIKAFNRPGLLRTIEKLEYDLAFIKRGTPLLAVIYIRKAVGYDGFLEEYAQRKGIAPSEFSEILDRMEEEASCFGDFDQWFFHISKMKNELERQQDMSKGEKKDAVTITTMHGAKGLEYDVVFLPDVNEGITPYQKAMGKDEEEQERRMFYVAVTRAASKLHVFSTKYMNGKETVVSRFVKEMLDFS